MNKKIISFIIVFCLLITTVASATDAGITSGSILSEIQGHWAEQEILSLQERGVIESDEIFETEDNVTRSQWFIWLGKNIILPFVSPENRFKDVTGNDECFDYVGAFYKEGIIPDEMIVSDCIGKNEILTRQEMIYTAIGALKLRLSVPLEESELNFSDKSKISIWALEAVKQAASKEIIVNESSSKFRPLDAATNAECAVVLSRLYDVFKSDFEYTRFMRIQKTANGSQGTGGRSYVYSALCLLYLGTDIEKANTLLNDTKIIGVETHDDFEASPFQMYWCVPAYLKTYMLFNSENGTLRKDVLTPETESNMRKVIWSFIESYYPNIFTDDNDPLRITNSENHDALQKTSLYLAAQILNKTNTYKDKVLPDGKTLPEFIAHAEDYFNKYITKRAQIGLFVEGSENYRVITFEALYNLIDFSDNEQLRQKAKMLTDISWIEYGIETINGIRGNAKTRVYNRKGDADTGFLWFSMLGSMYFGLNTEENPSPIASILISDYRPPLVAKEMALQESKGYFKYIKTTPGIGQNATVSFGSYSAPVYKLNENRDVVTYEYITPDYIASTIYQDDVEDLILLSSQNRWEGAIFKGDKNARIYRYLDTDRSLYGHFNSIQNGPIMMFKKNNTESYATGIYIYPFEFMENDGVLPTEDGWLFGQVGDSYYAVKPLDGTLEQKDNKILLTESESPFIIHLGSKKENCSFEKFKNKIKNNLLSYNGNTVYYKDKTWGEMEFNPLLSIAEARVVNDSSVPYNLEFIMKSPYLNSVKNSGVFDVTFNDQHIIYDFNSATITEVTNE